MSGCLSAFTSKMVNYKSGTSSSAWSSMMVMYADVIKFVIFILFLIFYPLFCDMMFNFVIIAGHCLLSCVVPC